MRTTIADQIKQLFLRFSVSSLSFYFSPSFHFFFVFHKALKATSLVIWLILRVRRYGEMGAQARKRKWTNTDERSTEKIVCRFILSLIRTQTLCFSFIHQFFLSMNNFEYEFGLWWETASWKVEVEQLAEQTEIFTLKSFSLSLPSPSSSLFLSLLMFRSRW